MTRARDTATLNLVENMYRDVLIPLDFSRVDDYFDPEFERNVLAPINGRSEIAGSASGSPRP